MPSLLAEPSNPIATTIATLTQDMQQLSVYFVQPFEELVISCKMVNK